MATSLHGILEQIEAQLVLKVAKLTTLTVEWTTELTGYTPRVSKYGAVIFGCAFNCDGFRGGLEFKEVAIDIAFFHVRSTDVRSEDRKAIEMLFTELTDQSRVGMQARFFPATDGALSEPMELLRQRSPLKTKTNHLRCDQHWRCMYHHFIKDHLSA